MAWWPGDSFCVKQSSRVPNAFSANARHTSRGLLGAWTRLSVFTPRGHGMETVVMAEKDRGNERHSMRKEERRGLGKGDSAREEGQQISSQVVHMYAGMDLSRLLLERTPSLATASPELVNQNMHRGATARCVGTSYTKRHAAAQRSTSSRSTSGAADLPSAPPASHVPIGRAQRWQRRASGSSMSFSPNKANRFALGDNLRHGWGGLCRSFSCSAGPIWGKRHASRGKSGTPWVVPRGLAPSCSLASALHRQRKPTSRGLSRCADSEFQHLCDCHMLQNSRGIIIGENLSIHVAPSRREEPSSGCH